MFIYLGRRAAKYYVTGGIGNPTSSRSVLDSVIMSAGLLLVLLATIASSYEDDTCDGKDTIPAINLKNNLFCNYYPDIRPVRNHQNTTKVTIRMILKYFTYDELSSSLEVDSWMSMHWKDEHLTWDPKKYDGIESITLKDSEIWMPDISIYNRANQGGSPAAVEGAHCIVASTGIVVCVPPTHHTALCVADLTKFPFDEQNCSLRFGSWVHAGEEINFTLSDPAILLDDIESNGDWEIVKSNAFRFPGVYKSMPNNTYPSLHFSFKIKRLYSSHSATVIIPSVVIFITTLTSLWISPTNKDRLTLCYVNFVSQFMHLQYISYSIPIKGDNVPKLVSYSRDSLLLCTFTIVLTVILKNLICTKNQAPSWVSSFVSFLIGCRPGQIILLNDYSLKGVASAKGEEDGSTIVANTQSNTEENQDWLIFAKVIDRLCFIIYCIIYIIMLIAFTP